MPEFFSSTPAWDPSSHTVKYVLRAVGPDAAAQDGIGIRDGTGVRKGTKMEERTCTKVLHLGRKYRSPNQDWELSAGELNGREIEARELT